MKKFSYIFYNIILKERDKTPKRRLYSLENPIKAPHKAVYPHILPLSPGSLRTVEDYE